MSSRVAALTVALIALTTDMLVYGIAVPVLPAIAAEAGTGGTGVGVLFASYAAALIATTPLVGRWVDRRGPREPMLVGLAGLGVSTFLFAAFDSLALLVAGRAAQGAAAAVTWTASLALIAAAYPPAERGRPMGLALSAIGIGTLAGPPLGGFLYEELGRAAPFILAAGLAAGDGLARVLLVRDTPTRGDVAVGYRMLLADRRAAVLVVLTSLGAFTFAYMEPILPLRLESELGAGAGTVGVVFGVATLASSFVAPSLGSASDRLPKAPLTVAGAIVAAVGMVALPAADSVPATTLALAVAAIGGALILVPTLALIGELAESRQPPSYGAAYALNTLAYSGGLTAAPLLAGLTAGTLGFRGAASVAGAACLAAAAAAVLAFRNPAATASLGPRPRLRPPHDYGESADG